MSRLVSFSPLLCLPRSDYFSPDEPDKKRLGDHCVITDCSYGGTNRAARVMFSDLGITFSFVDFRDPEIVRAAIRPNTKLIFSETPSNPTLTLTDVRVSCNLLTRVSKRVVEGLATMLVRRREEERKIYVTPFSLAVVVNTRETGKGF